MANQDFGTGKSLVVLAIVVGCFAILWPKIFYPMMQTAFAMTSPKIDNDSPFRDTDRPPHLHPGAINPRMRSSLSNDVEDKFHMREGRPFPHPQARQPVKTPPKSGGAMSIIMPIYTVGIIVFFLYTVLKLVFKKPSETEKKPIVKDFHMDPQYAKFMCNQPSDKSNQNDVKSGNKYESKENKVSEKEGKDVDPKDYEIYKLRKKLEETEEAMNRIMKHMGAMSEYFTGMEKNCTSSENSDVRLRHICGSKQKENELLNTSEEYELIDAQHKQLQDDFAKAMLSAAQATMKSCAEKLSDNSVDQLYETNSNEHSESEEIEENSVEQSDDNEGSIDEAICPSRNDQKKMNDDNCYSKACCKISPSEKAL